MHSSPGKDQDVNSADNWVVAYNAPQVHFLATCYLSLATISKSARSSRLALTLTQASVKVSKNALGAIGPNKKLSAYSFAKELSLCHWQVIYKIKHKFYRQVFEVLLSALQKVGCEVFGFKGNFCKKIANLCPFPVYCFRPMHFTFHPRFTATVGLALLCIQKACRGKFVGTALAVGIKPKRKPVPQFRIPLLLIPCYYYSVCTLKPLGSYFDTDERQSKQKRPWYYRSFGHGNTVTEEFVHEIA